MAKTPSPVGTARCAVTGTRGPLPPCAPCDRRQRLFLGGLLVLLVLAVYYPILHAGYEWDDSVHFRNNTFMRDAAGFKALWLQPRQNANPIAYYPVTMSLFWVQCQIFGAAHAAPFHAVSLALFIGNVLLAWWLLRLLHLRWAWLAALIFALHPMQVETVAWISEQKNLLALLFGLLAAGTFILAHAAVRPVRRWGGYGLALLLFVLALLSKAVVVPLPLALLLILWWKQGRVRWRDLWAVAPLLVVGLGIAALFAWVNLNLRSQEADLAFTSVQRLLIAGRAVGFYVGQLLWPTELLVMYPRWSVQGAGWEYLYPAGVAAVLVLLLGLRRRCGIGPLVGGLIFLVMVSPALGFVNFSYLRLSFVADHFTYVANLSLFAVFAEMLRRGSARLAVLLGAAGRRVAGLPSVVVCATVLVLLLAPLTWGYACLHQNMIATWQYAVDHNPRSWIAHAVLASAYMDAGDKVTALRQARQSLDIADNQLGLQVAAVALMQQGRVAESAGFFQRLAAENLAMPIDWLCYGRQEALLGHDEQAAAAFEACLRLDPSIAAAWDELTVCRLRQQRWSAAAAAARAALAYQENYAPAHCNLAAALRHLGDLPGTIEHYRRGVELDPGLVAARLQLGDALAVTGDWAAAAAQYRQVLAAAPDSAAVKTRLAEAQRRLNGPTP